MKETEEIFEKKRYKKSFYSFKNKIRIPNFANEDDGLMVIKNEMDVLLMIGRFSIATLVQANSGLFSAGKCSMPANVLFSYDHHYYENIKDLEMIARRIYNYKNKHDVPEDIRVFSDIISDELIRAFNIKIPHALTGGRDVYFTTILVDPKHLPDYKLSGQVYPFLSAIGKTDASMILPCKYWSKTFKKRWENG